MHCKDCKNFNYRILKTNVKVVCKEFGNMVNTPKGLTIEMFKSHMDSKTSTLLSGEECTAFDKK